MARTGVVKVKVKEEMPSHESIPSHHLLIYLIYKSISILSQFCLGVCPHSFTCKEVGVADDVTERKTLRDFVPTK